MGAARPEREPYHWRSGVRPEARAAFNAPASPAILAYFTGPRGTTAAAGGLVGSFSLLIGGLGL